MKLSNQLFSVDLAGLVGARNMAHQACQWPSRAARANLEVKADDSHSNLGWSDKHDALLSHPLDAAQQYQLGFSFANQSLIWLHQDVLTEELELANESEESARIWVDSCLENAGLRSTAFAEMPYELAPVNYGFGNCIEETEILGRWFAQADNALTELVEQQTIAIGEPSVRCWPHHFDLATLLMLEEGDPESAKSIGIGLSPGDGSHAEPYFYCSPWPVPATLPPAPAPASWHTEGFTSLVTKARDLEDKELAALMRDWIAVVEEALTC
jgi:hypothetical protein